jgi:hypothetical protein
VQELVQFHDTITNRGMGSLYRATMLVDLVQVRILARASLPPCMSACVGVDGWLEHLPAPCVPSNNL